MVQIGCKVTPELFEVLQSEWQSNNDSFPTFADYLRSMIVARHKTSQLATPDIKMSQVEANQYEALLRPMFEKVKGSYLSFKSIDGIVKEFAIEKPIDILNALLKTNKFI
ncbi:hypothetical protein [Emticicia sp. SJ17W-69]|uniref:hypothetical protein n=1 Tax=Emticicia sp. SJ17W-69 TaxID=3421657 RepID=UPI003EB87633